MSARVLAAEDSPTQAEALRAALLEGGYQVTLARSGDEALDLLATEPPDVVLSDIMMPGAVDGYELCRRIKGGAHRDIPVMLLTSLSDPMDIIRGLEAGADNFITKPYEPAHLLERLRILLTTRQTRARGRVRAGVTVYFMGREFQITSEREQILDLLVATFEDAVRQNHELREREQELTRTKEQLARYAGTLQEQLQDIIDHSPGIIYVKDLHSRYQLVNSQFERLFGVSREQVRGRTDEGVLPPGLAAALSANERAVLESDGVHQFDEEVILPDGPRTFLSVKFPLKDRSGETYAVGGISTDITERKIAEEALRDSESRYRMLFDQSPHPLWVFDRTTLLFLAVNQAAVASYGYTPGEFLEMTVADLQPPEAAGRLGANPEGSSSAFPFPEQCHKRKDGTLLDVEVTAHDVTFNGRPARLVLATDVTERRRAERALFERARQQAAVAALGQLALAAGGVDDLIEEAVNVAASTLGTEYAMVLELQTGGKTLLLRAGAGWREGWVGIAKVPAGVESPAGYTLNVAEPVIVEDLASERRFLPPPLLLEHGVISSLSVVIAGRPRSYGVLGVSSSERRRFSVDDANFLQAIANVLAAAIERDRVERSLGLAQRLEAVGRLAGGVAHDFNNLLTVISGSAEFAISLVPPDSEVLADIEEIRRAAARAAALTRQLLAFSRRQVLQPVVLSINEIVKEIDTMLRRLIGEDVELRSMLDPELGTVRADPGQIEQVILNLVVNARDAMPRGGRLVIETANVSLDEGYLEEHGGTQVGPHVMLAVSDTGEGMDRETQARIFEPFFTTKGEQGTGLGLATVYGIVKQSGGSIWVYSEPGHGTTFKVYLPRIDEQPPVVQGLAALAVAAGGSETVLLVEDDDAVRHVGERMLRSAGYRVLTAGGGPEAIEVAERHDGPIHLLVTDMVMPGMGGPDLAEGMMQRNPALRVLFLSGYTEPTFLEHPLLRSGTPFLQKPFTAETLVRKVREILAAPPA